MIFANISKIILKTKFLRKNVQQLFDKSKMAEGIQLNPT